MEFAIKVRNLEKFYGNFQAVKGIDFDVPFGSCFGFLGPNGAGKTTTLKILVNLLKASKGTAELLGFDSRNIKARQKIGYLPERIGLNNNWTLYDFLIFIGALYGLSRKICKDRALELLEWVGLAGWEYNKIGNLSGGMRQRLGLAQALLNDPELLILDEPTANLDAIGRAEILEKIKFMVERDKKTVLISSHILSEVEKVADNIAIINKGKIVTQGQLSALQNEKMATFEVKVSDPFALKKEMEKLDFILSADINERNQLIVESNDKERLSKALVRIVVERDLTLYQFSPISESLESLFMRLVREIEVSPSQIQETHPASIEHKG